MCEKRGRAQNEGSNNGSVEAMFAAASTTPEVEAKAIQLRISPSVVTLAQVRLIL